MTEEDSSLMGTYRVFARLRFPGLGRNQHKIIAAMMLAAVQADREERENDDARRD